MNVITTRKQWIINIQHYKVDEAYYRIVFVESTDFGDLNHKEREVPQRKHAMEIFLARSIECEIYTGGLFSIIFPCNSFCTTITTTNVLLKLSFMYTPKFVLAFQHVLFNRLLTYVYRVHKLSGYMFYTIW